MKLNNSWMAADLFHLPSEDKIKHKYAHKVSPSHYIPPHHPYLIKKPFPHTKSGLSVATGSILLLMASWWVTVTLHTFRKSAHDRKIEHKSYCSFQNKFAYLLPFLPEKASLKKLWKCQCLWQTTSCDLMECYATIFFLNFVSWSYYL